DEPAGRDAHEEWPMVDIGASAGRAGGGRTRIAAQDCRLATADQAEGDLYGRAARLRAPPDRTNPHEFCACLDVDRTLVFLRPQFAEHPDPYLRRPAYPRGLRCRQRQFPALGRLQPDRTARAGAYG